MKEQKLSFNASILNAKNIKVIVGLLIILVTLLTFATLRDTDTLITHKQANALYTKDQIQKVIVDGPYLRLKTPEESYKIL